MLRPHGRQRQSDDYSNRNFEETVKRDNPRGVRTRDEDNDGERDIHLTGGRGTVDWARVARLLRDTDYAGCLMWEIGAGREEFDTQILTDTMAGHLRLKEHLDAASVPTGTF